MSMINLLKKYLGIVWMLLGPAIIFFQVRGALTYIQPGGKEIHNPVIWIIIITIFTPIAIGLVIFGYYAWKNEYDHLPESSGEVE